VSEVFLDPAGRPNDLPRVDDEFSGVADVTAGAAAPSEKTKKELLAEAKAAGLDVSDKSTKAEIAAALEAAAES